MDFYGMSASPPCRSVIMAAKAVGVELNAKSIDLRNKEQMKPEYLRLNPQHTVPTIVDNGFSLWESRAILVYLAEKYGKSDSLYPKDPQKKAVVNQRLFFDMAFYKSYSDFYYPHLFLKKPADPEKFKQIETNFAFLNTFLEGHSFVAGDELTLADLAILATVSTFDVVDFDFSEYGNVTRWYENCKKVAPGWAENWEGCLRLKKYIDDNLRS